MAIFCRTCVVGCCGHCVHYIADALELPGEDDCSGRCTLHGMRKDYLEVCSDFFCRAAQADGIGYAEPADSTHRGPAFKLSG